MQECDLVSLQDRLRRVFLEKSFTETLCLNLNDLIKIQDPVSIVQDHFEFLFIIK